MEILSSLKSRESLILIENLFKMSIHETVSQGRKILSDLGKLLPNLALTTETLYDLNHLLEKLEFLLVMN